MLKCWSWTWNFPDSLAWHREIWGGWLFCFWGRAAELLLHDNPQAWCGCSVFPWSACTHHTNTQLRTDTAALTQAQRVPTNENAEEGSSNNPNLKCGGCRFKALPALLVGPSEQQQSDAEISASNMEELQPGDSIESVTAERKHRLTSPHCQEHGWSDRLQRRQRDCRM